MLKVSLSPTEVSLIPKENEKYWLISDWIYWGKRVVFLYTYVYLYFSFQKAR